MSPEKPTGDEPFDAICTIAASCADEGGGLCCYPTGLPPGPFDQREIEARSDVLVYSTPPLERDFEVTGPVSVKLWAASSAPDTDFTAKLVDVEPDGFARNLTDGIIRARYRNSKSDPELIEPGRVYEYTIDLWATSNLFKAGHQIRLEISSSNFPRFDRNSNTGASPAPTRASSRQCSASFTTAGIRRTFCCRCLSAASANWHEGDLARPERAHISPLPYSSTGPHSSLVRK